MDSNFEKRVNLDISYFDRLSEIEKNYSLNRVYHLHSTSNLNKFSSAEIKEYWEKLARDIKDKRKYGITDLYIHVPFCRKKCLYCNYYSKIASNEREVEDYLSYIKGDMEFLSNTFSGIQFSNLYIGGGTPSILNYRQLDRFFSSIFSLFDFKKESGLTFEFNPLSINLKKLDLVKKYGFNRISFGIQTFDKNVLLDMNRDYHPYSLIKKIVEYAQRKGFENIDADLIIDLKGQNPSAFLRSFYKLAKLRLTEIEVFPLIPTKRYIDARFGGSLPNFYEYRKRIIPKVAKRIKGIAKKYGYRHSGLVLFDTSWSFYKDKKPKKEIGENLGLEEKMLERARNIKAGVNPEVFSFLGIGPSAMSHIYGHLSYMNRWEQCPRKFDPIRQAYTGTPLSIKDEMTRYILGNIIRLSKVPLRFFSERFKSELTENFDYAIKALKMLKKIKIDDDFLYFLPTDQKERFIYAMFFLGEDYLRILSSASSQNP